MTEPIITLSGNRGIGEYRSNFLWERIFRSSIQYRAYVWWSVNAAQGSTPSRTNRDVVADKLTPEQLARGQEIATRCFESDYQDCE